MSEKKKIALEVYREFASKDECRWAITQPRVIDGLIVATDGRVLVECPVEEVETEGLTVLEDIHFPDYRGIIDPEFTAQLWPLEMPPLPEKVVKMVECWDCKGKGTYNSGAECGECDGKGEWEDDEAWHVKMGDYALKGKYVEMIQRLPKVRWFTPAAEKGKEFPPVRFGFGEQGRGMLMPMRVTPEDTEKPCAKAHLGKVLCREADLIAMGETDLSPTQTSALIECLAKVVGRAEVDEIHKIFGSPGDWGYGTPIGDALRKIYGV